MPFCPQCGAPNPPNAAFCGVCGASIPARAPENAGAPTSLAQPSLAQPSAAQPSIAQPQSAQSALGRTVLMQPPVSQAAPVAPAPQPAPVAATKLDAKKTMLGFSTGLAPAAQAAGPVIAAPPPPIAPPPQAPPEPAAPSPPAKAMNRTMLGMAPMTAQGANGPAASSSAAPAPAAAPANVAGKKTMIGMASPVAPQKAPEPAKKGKGQTMLVGKSPFADVGKKTLMGVAAPNQGAPMRRTLMGMPVPKIIAPPEPEYVEEYYDEIVPETGEVERRVRIVQKPPPPLYKRPGLYVLAAACLLLVGGLAVAFLVKSPPPLSAEVRVDAARKESLHVTCKGCPDGTTLSAGDAKTSLAGGEGDLAMTTPLKVGENKIAIAIDRHGAGRDETVTLDVPIAYRIWPELAALQDPTPSVRVMIEALPGSTVSVQGKQVALAADGTAAYKVDVSDALTGLSKDVKTLDREVPYTIASQGGAPESGKLAVKIGIVPLTLESPGARMVTDQATFWLAGRTAKGAGLSVAGKPISVTKDGTFEQMMNISRVGSTEVELRASAPSFAPRIATITVKRVDSLAQEAKDIDAQPRASYADVLAKGDAAAGTPIGWKAEVVQPSVQGRQTIAVVEVATGCAKKPCRARVIASNAPTLATGDKLSVYGRVVGTTSGGPQIPDVEADFVLKGP